MKTGKSIIIFSIVFLFVAFTPFKVRAQGLTFRIMPKIGASIVHPSVDDLEGYTKNQHDGGKFNIANFGITTQILKNMSNFNIGVEAGFQKLWSAEIHGAQESVSFIDLTQYDETRSDLYFLGIVELPIKSNILLQGGLGLHTVFGEYTYTYKGGHDEDTTYNGTGVALGMMAGGGFDIPISNNISMPILVRLDIIPYEGLIMPLSIMIGLSFDL